MRFPTSLTAGLLVALTATAWPSADQTSPRQPPAQTQQTPQTQQPQQDQQQQPERAQQPPIRTGINFVRVDVIVTDKNGAPVLDLKPEDFSVTEDGKPQKVESFSVVKIDAAAQVEAEPLREIRTPYDEEREAQRPDVRLFVILLDDYHVRRGNDMAVRKPLIDFVENQLAPADMVERTGTAVGITFLGAQTRIRVRVEDGIEISAVRQNEESTGAGAAVPPGTQVRLAWRRDAMIPLEG